MIPTIIITAVIAIAFLAVVIKGIIDKKNGKHSCSCGGSCGACPMGCGCHEEKAPK